MNNRSLMLFLEEDSTSIFGSGWTLLWTKNANAILIVYRTCWTKNTKNELRIERERDLKLGLIVYFPIIMISDQIKHSHTRAHLHQSIGWEMSMLKRSDNGNLSLPAWLCFTQIGILIPNRRHRVFLCIYVAFSHFLAPTSFSILI